MYNAETFNFEVVKFQEWGKEYDWETNDILEFRL